MGLAVSFQTLASASGRPQENLSACEYVRCPVRRFASLKTFAGPVPIIFTYIRTTLWRPPHALLAQLEWCFPRAAKPPTAGRNVVQEKGILQFIRLKVTSFYGQFKNFATDTDSSSVVDVTLQQVGCSALFPSIPIPSQLSQTIYI